MPNDTKVLTGGTQDASSAIAERSTPIQWFRELLTGGISVVVLILAAVTIHGTWSFARDHANPVDDKAAAAQKESYERQKDIMLYALALLGTVTGYYLGRVPAELHAQQAQRSANSAQQELQSAQSKLTDTAGNAAVALSQVSEAREQRDKAQQKERRTQTAIQDVKKELSDKVAKAKGQRRANLSAGETATDDGSVQEMERILAQIDKVLQQTGD